MPLTSEVVPVFSLTSALRDELFGIFAAAYDGATRRRFDSDLGDKSSVILLRSEERVVGFSTQKVFEFVHRQRRLRVLFSGDTIIAPAHWGTQELVRAWCRFAGTVKGEEPETPLYWLLISKGHRTYLYLPLFFRRYQPASDTEPDALERELMTMLGSFTFGERYDAATGLIDAHEPHDRLRPSIDSAPDRLHNSHVAFFVARNPQYREGAELLCLAEIAPENMRSFARREVERGMDAAMTPAGAPSR